MITTSVPDNRSAAILKANGVFKALGRAGNNPAPVNNGQVNTAASKTGQCSGL